MTEADPIPVVSDPPEGSPENVQKSPEPASENLQTDSDPPPDRAPEPSSDAPKKKRKRSEAQVTQLQVARKKAAEKKRATKKIKVEKEKTKIIGDDGFEVMDEFSWKNEFAKVFILGGISLASVAVQQHFSQTKKQPPSLPKKVSESSKDSDDIYTDWT